MSFTVRVAVPLLFLAATFAHSQTTPEEREIRQTYARVALASEIGAVQNAVSRSKDLNKELENSRVEFRLSDFRAGKVADHLNDHYSGFISRPNGQTRLQITPSTNNFEDNTKGKKDAYRNVYASVQWAGKIPVAPIDWETMPLSHALDATHATDGSTILRFVSYTVTTTFQGKMQTVTATWWYGTDKDGKPLVVVADLANDSSALYYFRLQPIYPAIFLDHPGTRKNPVVEKWLMSVSQDCKGNQHGDCFDETSGRAGVSREDVERGPIDVSKPMSELRRFEINQPCKGDACSPFTKSEAADEHSFSGGEGHLLGFHLMRNTGHGTCSYSGSAVCSVSCNAVPSGLSGETDGSSYVDLLVWSHAVGTNGAAGGSF